MSQTVLSNKDIVLALADALNRHDLDKARTYISNDLEFHGVFGSSQGADAYLQSMASVRTNQEVKKVFADGNEVCVFYDLSIAAAPGTTLFGCGWFKLQNKKITFIRVVFDPRPLAAHNKQ
jgi:limonene-1,2-epoxide hydrolase